MTDYAIHCTDCVTGLREHVEPGSIDLTVTSIPFGALFQYSGKTEDIGTAATASTSWGPTSARTCASSHTP